MDVTLRSATAADADALAHLHLRTVTHAYAHIFPPHAAAPRLDDLLADWRRLCTPPAATVLVVTRAEQLVGSVVAKPDAEQPTVGQVAKLHVDPQAWSAGIGSTLLAAATDTLATRGFSRLGLWVLEHNTRARRLYELHGWTFVAGRTLDWPDLGVTEVRYERAVDVTLSPGSRPADPEGSGGAKTWRSTS